MAGEVLAFLSTISFVLSSAIFRKVETVASPVQISTFRTAVGLVTFLFLGLYLNVFSYFPLFSLHLYIILVISILFGQVFGDTLFLFAQEHIGTTISITLSLTFPYFTFLISFIFTGELLSFQRFISSIIVSIGILLITFSRGEESDKYEQDKEISRKGYYLAIFIALLASVFWGVATVFTDIGLKEVSKLIHQEGISTITANVFRFPIATGFLLGMSIKSSKTSIRDWSRSTWAWLLIGSLIGTSLGAYLWAESSRVAGASLSSLIYSTAPLYALPISYFLNREKITKQAMVGVIVTITGVVLIFV